MIIVPLDIQDLADTGQIAVLIFLAIASGDGTVVRERIFDFVADHAVGIRIGIAVEEFHDFFKGIAAIEVIGIADDERVFLQDVAARQQGMRRSPRFYSSFRDLYAFRDIIQILVGVFDFDVWSDLFDQ